VTEGTGHQRITVWSEGFAEWRRSPLFGIGWDNYADTLGIAAHNSFVHGYTELGFVGGTCFLGAFYLALLLPYRVGATRRGLAGGELYRLRPYLMGIIAGYVMGMLSSSRTGIPPTYMLVGLSAAHVWLAGKYVPTAVTSLNRRLVREVLLASALSVAALYLFVRISLAQS
jgi:O-antigen ligase